MSAKLNLLSLFGAASFLCSERVVCIAVFQRGVMLSALLSRYLPQPHDNSNTGIWMETWKELTTFHTLTNCYNLPACFNFFHFIFKSYFANQVTVSRITVPDIRKLVHTKKVVFSTKNRHPWPAKKKRKPSVQFCNNERKPF